VADPLKHLQDKFKKLYNIPDKRIYSCEFPLQYDMA